MEKPSQGSSVTRLTLFEYFKRARTADSLPSIFRWFVIYLLIAFPISFFFACSD
jgi:hypothetical protein